MAAAAVAGEGIDALLGSGGASEVRTLRIAVPESVAGHEAKDALRRLIEGLPRLESVAIAPTGAYGRTNAPALIELARICRRRRLVPSLEFVLDPDADAFAALSRRPTSLTSVLELSRTLRQKDLAVRWSVPLHPSLVWRLEALFSLARDEGLDAVLSPTRRCSGSGRPAPPLGPDEELFVIDFISYRLLNEAGDDPARGDLYRRLRDAPGAADPPTPDLPDAHVVLHADAGATWALHRGNRRGALRMASRHLRRMPGASTAAHLAEVAGVVCQGGRGFLQWAVAAAGALPGRPAATPADRLPRVLLIGAYGGEHIGDAAILGGVLFRFHRRHGTIRAVLMSQRPAHTRHLVRMLELPVDLSVEAYTPGNVRRHLREVDAVVFAGGPLIDLPKQLVLHLYTVSLARRHVKPFIAEGIGPGPFIRRPSAWTARRIVRMAERITVRTRSDAGSPLVRGLNPEIGHDPAFDYLATRPVELTRLPPAERQWLEDLLEDAKGRLLVGMNVRPIFDLYTVGAPARGRAEYTRFVQARFEARLAEGLGRFRESWRRPITVVFFPMNAIQFGLSDLRSAYRIARLLGDTVDLRVFEADVSLDGVVALLRRLDIAITMRFHATIFALAQQCRVIGIDYRIGRSDKVAALLRDFEAGANCSRIDEMTAEWLWERLCALAAAPGERRS